MRFALSFVALCLLLTVCRHRDALQQDSSYAPPQYFNDAEIQSTLPGTWIFEHRFLSISFRSVTTVGSNGDYVSQLTLTKSNDITTLQLEGTWQVRDGVLIDAMTNNSDPEVHLPYTSERRISRANDHELVFKVGRDEHVFRKETK
jgi:hypothetical protein